MTDRQRLIDEIGIPSDYYDAVYDGAEKLTALTINYEDDEFSLDGSDGLLKRLGSFQSLKELEIITNSSGLAFFDLIPISQLLYLEHLVITNCSLHDISPLATCQNLKLLHLTGTGITDVTALGNLKQLTELNLSQNCIVDISPLKELTGLTYANLSFNQITDISAIHSSKGLLSLIINSNRITDLSPVNNLTRLSYLRADQNHITDISTLQLLVGLQSLKLSQNPISNLGPLAPLVDLELLDIIGIAANDIQPIYGALKLKKLAASNIKSIDRNIIGRFVFLTHLTLKNCNIYDISFLKPLVNLVRLELDDNQIQQADILTTLPKLDVISLRNNNVSRPFDSYPYHCFGLNLEGNPFGKNFRVFEDYIISAAFYYYTHGDWDKALAYHYVEIDEKKSTEEWLKIALLIYYRKLTGVNHWDNYYRLYYVMRCEQLLKAIKSEDDEIKLIRTSLINIIKESHFFNCAELLISLEENGKAVDNYERFAEYLDYLKNTANPTPNTEIAYFLAKTFMRWEDLPQLLSIYRQLLDKNDPFHFTLYRMIKRVLSYKHNSPDFDQYLDLLHNAKHRQIPYFDVYKYLDWAFTGYVHGQPPPRPKAIDWQPQVSENYSGWKVLCWIFAILLVLVILYRFSV